MKNQSITNDKILATLDKGNFLRGLLLLIRKDNKINEHEAAAFYKAGEELGYDKEFCQEAIRNLLRNDHINNDPPVFHNKILAEKFLSTGFRLINKDLDSRNSEIHFLENVAENNGLKDFWNTEIKSFQQFN